MYRLFLPSGLIDRARGDIVSVVSSIITASWSASMNKYIFTFVCLSFVSSAFAKPAYIECVVSSESEKQPFSVKIDDDSGKVTHSQPGGFAFNADGFFSVDKITYQKIDLFDGIKMVRVFNIDRTDLSATYTSEISSTEFPDKLPSQIITMTGSCNLVEVKQRKI